MDILVCVSVCPFLGLWRILISTNGMENIFISKLREI